MDNLSYIVRKMLNISFGLIAAAKIFCWGLRMCLNSCEVVTQDFVRMKYSELSDPVNTILTVLVISLAAVCLSYKIDPEKITRKSMTECCIGISACNGMILGYLIYVAIRYDNPILCNDDIPLYWLGIELTFFHTMIPIIVISAFLIIYSIKKTK